MQSQKITHRNVNYFLLDSGKQPVWSFSEDSETMAGIILDLSPFGGRLLMPQGTQLSTDKIIIHVKLNSPHNRLTLESRVLWHKIKSPIEHIEIGCEFIRPDNDAKLRLMQYIRENNAQGKRMIARCELL